jgi:hypothetical protein
MYKNHHRWVFDIQNTNVADKLAPNRRNRLQALMSSYQA